MTNWYPVKMQPAFKDYLWGGTRLNADFGKQSPYAKTAESWELADHPNGSSLAANGPLNGLTLGKVIQAFGPECLGEHCKNANRFPLLIKLIDAEQKLSIQVHPDDAYANLHEGQSGKTEMWVVVDAKPGSGIYCGFRQTVTKNQFETAIASNTLPELLNFIPCRPGDVFFIPPGTIHAICDGMLIAEIQQNSDVTYRVSDYGRLGADGKPRALHVKQSLEVANLQGFCPSGKPQGQPMQKCGYTEQLLCSCPLFTVQRIEIPDQAEIAPLRKSFRAFTIVSGSGLLCWEDEAIDFQKGDTFFIPAGLKIRMQGQALLLDSSL